MDNTVCKQEDVCYNGEKETTTETDFLYFADMTKDEIAELIKIWKEYKNVCDKKDAG